MEFFIDTGDINEIKMAYSWGFVDGVTTNPSLVAKTGKKQSDLIKEIAEIVDGPISAEVISTDAEGMIKEGTELRFTICGKTRRCWPNWNGSYWRDQTNFQ